MTGCTTILFDCLCVASRGSVITACAFYLSSHLAIDITDVGMMHRVLSSSVTSK